MLLELHIRNLALIEKTDLELYEGLTVLSGETGAGKSILIDSIHIALGGKASRDMIRSGQEQAYVELLFSIEDKEKLELIRFMDVPVAEDGLITVIRRITPTKNTIRVNDEGVSAAKLRSLTGLLIDIHGQHEHHSLLHTGRHLDMVDEYGKRTIEGQKNLLADLFSTYKKLKEQLAMGEDRHILLREREILSYEVEEIDGAALREGEEEELKAEYRKLRNRSKILEALSRALHALAEDGISSALREVSEAAALDETLEAAEGQLSLLEESVQEVQHTLSNYLDGDEYDEGRFRHIEERLDLINRLQRKYGADIGAVLLAREEKRIRLSAIEHFEKEEARLRKEETLLKERLHKESEKLTLLRRAAAGSFMEELIGHLRDLRFNEVNFDIRFTKSDEIGYNGWDKAEFFISTNPGEPVKPLKEVASGGELSRIMLALKTVMAKTDAIDTLIFDEIDAGISGRTAQRVSEKLSLLANHHQVICITHLPQIAAMADHHYLIEKSTDGKVTTTDIEYLREEEMVGELARLIGGSAITPAVMETAKEMKRLADSIKNNPSQTEANP